MHRKRKKATLAGYFNFDFNTQEGENFIKALRFQDFELRTNPEYCTT